jgi:hypothetical protein
VELVVMLAQLEPQAMVELAGTVAPTLPALQDRLEEMVVVLDLRQVQHLCLLRAFVTQ